MPAAATDYSYLQHTALADQWWRLCNLYTIRDKQGRLVPFRPNVEQEEYYRNRHLLNHIGKARQLGFSTFEKILDLDAMLFPSGDRVLPPTPDGVRCGHIDATIEDAKKKLRIVLTAYDNLDNPELHPETAALGKAIKEAIPIKTRSKEALEFTNGSAIWVGVSLRGDTPQKLTISELGKIAYFFPLKAEEIRSGALNTIAPGNCITIESTHEGGEAGLHYELLNLAIKNGPAPSPIDFKFHFFPWWKRAEYTLEADIPLRPSIEQYFARLEATTGRSFTMAQKRWYDRTETKQRYAMMKEYPSTPGEMFQAINQTAIYGKELADLAAMSPPRILDFGPEALPPIYTFQDIGHSDHTAMWLIQPMERFHLVLNWFEGTGLTVAQVAEVVRQWESLYGRTINGHYLPHDAHNKRPGDGKDYAEMMREAGLMNVHVVPRIPDIWIGIGHTRDVLPHCYFHKTNTDTAIEVDGQTRPSGLACLRGYHRELNPGNKTIREMPAHDQFSHTADAFRTFAEAKARGMLDSPSDSRKYKATGHSAGRRFKSNYTGRR